MKLSELDLTKAHVDQFKPAEDKSWDGSALALTKAGWATVTADGTIIEVLCAFSGAKPSIYQAFDARSELPGAVIDETDLLNPKMIGSSGLSAVDSQIVDPSPFAPNAALISAMSISNILNTINIAGTSAARTADLDLTTGVTTGQVELTVAMAASEGYAPYSYSWTVKLNAGSPVALADTTASITYTLEELETALGDTVVASDVVVITSVTTDSAVPTASTLTRTATLTVV